MSPLRAIARPLLASVFIVDGWDAMRNPDKHAEKLKRFEKPLEAVSKQVPVVPSDPTTLARVSGAISVGAGVLLATGKFPRLAASVLALVSIPVTLVNNPVGTTQERRDNLSGLLRSAGLLGGLIFAAEDRRGKPSLGYRREINKEHRAELADLKADLKADVKAAKAS